MNRGILRFGAVFCFLIIITMGVLLYQRSQRIAELEKVIASRELTATNAVRAIQEPPKQTPPPTQKAKHAPRRPIDTTPPPGADTNVFDKSENQSLIVYRVGRVLEESLSPLFDRVRLSPAEFEIVRRQLAERLMIVTDVQRAFDLNAPDGVRATEAEVNKLARPIAAEIDGQIQQTLGQERYQQYEHYIRHVEAYNALDRIERRVSAAGQPLTAEQSNSVLTLLVKEMPETTPSSLGRMVLVSPLVRVGLDKGIPNQVFDSTRDLLSPAQHAAIDSLKVQSARKSGPPAAAKTAK